MTAAFWFCLGLASAAVFAHRHWLRAVLIIGWWSIFDRDRLRAGMQHAQTRRRMQERDAESVAIARTILTHITDCQTLPMARKLALQGLSMIDGKGPAR